MKYAYVLSAIIAFSVTVIGCQNGSAGGTVNTERIPRLSQATVQAYGYKLIEQKNLSYIGGTVYVFEHIKSGACIQYVACDDKNISFTVSLSTPSDSNTGAVSVLSRMVLDCASLYPGKNVFQTVAAKVPVTHMAQSADGTVTQFSVATTQEKQFVQLADYYLSCVFAPTLDETVFKREAWHYELDSPSSPITINGNAYNRAKANDANLMRTVSDLVRESLFPATAAKNDAYGKARFVPMLTLSELESYRSTYFVPSNAIIGVYGNLNIERFLQFLNEKWLCRCEKSTPLVQIPKQEAFAKPKYVYKTVPLAPPLSNGKNGTMGNMSAVQGNVNASSIDVSASHGKGGASGASAASSSGALGASSVGGTFGANGTAGTGTAHTFGAASSAQAFGNGAFSCVTALSKGYALSGVTARDLPALLLTVNILNNPNSPLMQALDASGIAQSYALSLDLTTRQIQFEVIAYNADSAKASTFDKIITDVFADVAANGVNQELFDAVKVDFNANTVLVRENTQRGIDVLSNLAAGEILFSSRYALANAPLDAQNADVQNIKTSVKKYLLDNAHSVLVIAEGQTSLYAEQAQKEATRLNEIKASLSAQKIAALVNETASYKKAVSAPDAVTEESVQKLSVLRASDLTAPNFDVHITDETTADIRFLHTPVSGAVLRTSLLLDMSHLTAEELLYAKLYAALIGNMPAGTMGKEKTAYKLGTLILGMSGTLTPFYTDGACSDSYPMMNVSWFTESKNAEQAEKLMTAVLYDTVLDPSTLKVLVATEKAQADRALERDPSVFARRRAASAVHAPYALEEHLSGAAYYSFVQNVYKQVNKNPSPVIEKLLDVRNRMFESGTNRMPIVATCGNAPSFFTAGSLICAPIVAKSRPVTEDFKDEATLARTAAFVLNQSALHEALVMQIPSMYVASAERIAKSDDAQPIDSAQSVNASPITQKDAVLSALACDILTENYYNASDAQSGAAYAQEAVTVHVASGAGNVEKAVLTLNRASSFAKKAGVFKSEDLTPYIVSRFMKETAPEGDYTKAFNAQIDYLRGITPAQKTARLTALKAATVSDMERIIRAFDTGGRYTVCGNESGIKASSLPFDAVVSLE